MLAVGPVRSDCVFFKGLTVEPDLLVDMEHEKKTGVKNDSKVLGLRIWED